MIMHTLNISQRNLFLSLFGFLLFTFSCEKPVTIENESLIDEQQPSVQEENGTNIEEEWPTDRTMIMTFDRNVNPEKFLEILVLKNATSNGDRSYPASNCKTRISGRKVMILLAERTFLIERKYEEPTLMHCDEEKELVSVVLPSAITIIGEGLFMGCSKLASVTLPEGITTIPQYAFTNCPLTSIVFPEGLNTIDDYAFDGCLLSSITFNTMKYPARIGSLAFRGCPITSITFPIGLTIIDWAAFSGCALQSITFNNGLKEIRTEAFRDCPITSIVFPEGLKRIGWQAFYGCPLSTITFNEGLERIETQAFDGAQLQSITLPESIKHLEVSTFSFQDKEGLFAIVKATTPPKIYHWDPYAIASFLVGKYSDFTVYVPASSVEAYKKDGNWWQYNIQAIPETP